MLEWESLGGFDHVRTLMTRTVSTMHIYTCIMMDTVRIISVHT